MRDRLAAPGRLYFFGRNIDLESPLSEVGSFARKERIERNVGRRQGFPKSLQLLFGGHAEQFEQIAYTALDGADVKARGIVEQFLDVHVGATHREAFRDVSHAAAVFWPAQSVDDSSFEVADFNRFRFCDPVFHRAKEMRAFQQNKAEFGSMQRLVRYALGTGNEDGKLRLSHHAMEFHGGCMREIVGSGANQIARDQIGISGILDRGPELRGNDGEETAFQPGHETPLGSFMKKAARERRFQARDSRSVSARKCRLATIVQSHQELGHLTPGRSQIRVILYAQWIAYKAKNDACSISNVILYVKKIAQ